jgi:hypothetical protein
MAEYYCVVYIYIFLVHSSVSGHLDCFHRSATVNNAVINMSVQVSLLYPDLHFFGCTPKSGISGSYDSSVFSL